MDTEENNHHDNFHQDDNHLDTGSSDHSRRSYLYRKPHEGDPMHNKEDEIAQDETKNLLWLRGVTFCFLLVATLGVSMGVYFYLHTSEEARFEDKFFDTASKVLEALGTQLENTLGAVDAFSVATTTYARYSNTNNDNATTGTGWPFVTLPEYAGQGSKLRSLSKIYLLAMYHYIAHKDRLAWEAYTRANDQWVDQGIQTQKNDPTFRGNIVEDWSSLGEINYYGQSAENATYYVARWQSSPVVPRWDPYNWNIIQHPTVRDAIQRVLDSRTVVLSLALNVFGKDGPGEEEQESAVNLQDFIGENQFAYEPAVELYVPVVTGPPGMVSLRDPEISQDDTNLVAVMAVSIFWRDLITDVLPHWE